MAEYIEREAILKKQYNSSPLKDLSFVEMVVDVRDIEEAPAANVVALPCKVGDKIYQLDTAGEIYQSEITKIIYDTNGIAFDETAIGKTVFLTKEDAERAAKARIKNESGSTK